MTFVARTHPWIPVLPAFIGSAVFLAFFGPPPALWVGLSVFAFILFDSFGVQIGVHKLLSHRSFQTSQLTRRVLSFLSVLSGQGSPLFWVAVHMSSHHPYADQAADAHSPDHGLFHSFIGWYWNVDAKKISFSPAREFLRDSFIVFLHRHHNSILLSYWIVLALFGIKPLVFLGLLPAAMSISLVGLVNCFAHSNDKCSNIFLLKYKNHSDQVGFNSVILGLLTMGLGLHNNHHAHPHRPFNDERWFEVDLSRLIIPFLERKSGLSAPIVQMNDIRNRIRKSEEIAAPEIHP